MIRVRVPKCSCEIIGVLDITIIIFKLKFYLKNNEASYSDLP